MNQLLKKIISLTLIFTQSFYSLAADFGVVKEMPDGTKVKIYYNSDILDDPNVHAISHEQCVAMGKYDCDTLTYILDYRKFHDSLPLELGFFLETMDETYNGGSGLGSADLSEILLPAFVPQSYTMDMGAGLTFSTTYSSTVGAIDYDGADFASASVQMAWVDGDGRHNLKINSATYIDTISSGTADTLERFPKSVANDPDEFAPDIILEPAKHDLIQEYYIWPHSNGLPLKTQRRQLYELSNQVNDLWDDKDTNYQKAKALVEDLENSNQKLKETLESLSAGANELVSLHESEEFAKGLQLEEAMNNTKVNQDERIEDILVNLTSSGVLDQPDADILATAESNWSRNDAEIEALVGQLINSSDNLALHASNANDSAANAMDLSTNVILANNGNSDYFDKEFNLAPEEPELPETPEDSSNSDDPTDPLDPPSEPEKPSGDTLETRSHNTGYSKLTEALDYYNYVGDTVDLSDAGVKATYDLAGVGLEMADQQYAIENNSLGDEFLSTSLSLLDAAIDFVPGASLVKDSITIMTGKNPITGEEVSDVERAVMLGSLFVPAALSGTAKVVSKASKAISSISKKSSESAQSFKGIKDAIEGSDKDLKPFSSLPCGNSTAEATKSPKKVLDYLKYIAFTILTLSIPETHANTSGCSPGNITDDVLSIKTIDSQKRTAGTTNNWDPELINPKSNTIYNIDGHKYQTDDLARVDQVRINDLKLAETSAARHSRSGTEAGGSDRLDTDHGGHLVGAQFGGAGEKINIVAMDKKLNGNSLNEGTWGQMESEWKRRLTEDPDTKIDVDIKLHYEGDSKRPSHFEITETFNNTEIYKDTIYNIPNG